MSLFRKILIYLGVLLWLPLSGHCQLETIPGLEWLACCDHPDTAPHEDEDCSTDACATLEDGLFRSEIEAPDVSRPNLESVALLAKVCNLPARVSNPAVAPSPPERRASWQFLSRSALPIRAPSIAS